MRRVVVQIVRSPAGGIRKHIFDITDNLSNDFDFIFILDPSDGDEIFRRKLKEDKQLRSKIFELDIPDKPGVIDIKNIIRIVKFLRKMNPTIVHGHGAKGGLYARVVSLILGSKSIYTPHGGSLHEMHGFLKGILYTVVESLLSLITTLFIAESKYSRDRLVSKTFAFRNEIFLNENALDLPMSLSSREVKSFNAEERIEVSSFGLLRPIKGHMHILPVIGQLLKKGFNLHYTIYGSGELKDKLLDYAKELGMTGHFKIVENEAEVYKRMSESDIVIHPSLFESFGYVPLEALINGASVVSSLTGGLFEVMDKGRCGFCFFSFSKDEIENAILNCINNEGERKRKYNHAKTYIQENYSMERFADNQRIAYLRVLKN